MELLKEISQINNSFSKLGIPSSVLRDNESNQSIADQAKASGIVMKSKLSFRGQDKAREYFRFIDLDHDDLTQYADMRGIFVVAVC